MDLLSGGRKDDDRPNESRPRGGNCFLGVRGGTLPDNGEGTLTRVFAPEDCEVDEFVQETLRQDDALRELVGLGGAESNLLFQRRSVRSGVAGVQGAEDPREWPALWEECQCVVMRYCAKTGDPVGYSRAARCLSKRNSTIRYNCGRPECRCSCKIPTIREHVPLISNKEKNEAFSRVGSKRSMGEDDNW